MRKCTGFNNGNICLVEKWRYFACTSQFVISMPPKFLFFNGAHIFVAQFLIWRNRKRSCVESCFFFLAKPNVGTEGGGG